MSGQNYKLANNVKNKISLTERPIQKNQVQNKQLDQSERLNEQLQSFQIKDYLKNVKKFKRDKQQKQEPIKNFKQKNMFGFNPSISTNESIIFNTKIFEKTANFGNISTTSQSKKSIRIPLILQNKSDQFKDKQQVMIQRTLSNNQKDFGIYSLNDSKRNNFFQQIKLNKECEQDLQTKKLPIKRVCSSHLITSQKKLVQKIFKEKSFEKNNLNFKQKKQNNEQSANNLTLQTQFRIRKKHQSSLNNLIN